MVVHFQLKFNCYLLCVITLVFLLPSREYPTITCDLYKRHNLTIILTFT